MWPSPVHTYLDEGEVRQATGAGGENPAPACLRRNLTSCCQPSATVYQETQQQRYEEGGKNGQRSRKPGAG
ncbi:hypothetical protein C2W62_53285, partial [Candidatus Entotheonella serta]